MKKIIVPVDFSKHSEYALKVAADIARKNKAELFLLHMLDISDQMISITEATKRRELLFFMQLANKQFEKFIDKDYMKGIKSSPIIKHYKVFEEVDNTAKEIDAEFIIMGSRGSSGVKGYFVGSNTEKVVRTSDIPVLVVKSEAKDFNPKTIVFASDFNKENLNAFKTIKQFADSYDATLKLVYVNTPNANFKNTLEIREQMRNFLNKNSISNHSEDIVIFNDYTITDGIQNAALMLQADLIAIPTHGRKGINKILAGSISEEVANKSEIPVLTVKI
ncbi:universal stress protein [Planktosalinus lacus]|uniref:Universal stress protein UspA n=1 Tax=Planktosalinus lacus TaxID=1526573 RepID=A0A8J2Y914_9FLAO|nr:universal stress protein [Planktosalinus lacus]GGD84465.1 universal stress protein UspA [Planktosalinus lacus]